MMIPSLQDGRVPRAYTALNRCIVALDQNARFSGDFSLTRCRSYLHYMYIVYIVYENCCDIYVPALYLNLASLID